MDLEIVVYILAASTLAFGIGFLLQLRKTISIQSQRLLAESQAQQSQTQQQLLQQDLSELQSQHYQLQLLKSQLDERLTHAQTTEVRLKEEWAAHNKEIRHRFDEEVSQHKALRERYQLLSNDHVRLKTQLSAKEQHFSEQLEQLSSSRIEMSKEFQNLANRIFEEKGKTFATTSQSSLDVMLKPFKEQIEGFQKRVNDIHESTTRDNAHLNSEIKKVMEIGLAMSKEATNLTSALKGDSQQRGAWGEAQLRRTLEMSGLMEDAHYESQSSFKDADGKTKLTDYLIKLPDGKHLIIDSKVSLNAYDRVVSADTPEREALALEEHIRAVKGHIDDLASKDYTNVLGIRSPSFVLMFMPIEPAYIEALKSHKDLFDYGYRKGVVLVSHTTLIPILRTVSNLWMIERSNAEAREISEKAGDIFNTVGLLAERLAKLGSSLSAASGHYNKTVTALTGKQGLYGKVDRFKQLSAKVSKELPAVDHQHLDFDADKLQIIVEELPEFDDLVAVQTGGDFIKKDEIADDLSSDERSDTLPQNVSVNVDASAQEMSDLVSQSSRSE